MVRMLVFLQVLLLLTDLLVLVALSPSLELEPFLFPLLDSFFVYFSLKMLPASLTLCVLLLILTVAFGD